jgi:hypothetical protein
MKAIITRPLMLLFLISMVSSTIAVAQGRLIRKLQEKTEEKIIEGIFGEPEKEKAPATTAADERSPQARNVRGGGLSQEVPDVVRSISDADLAVNAGKYIDARSSVRNALWGVELEIGQNVLKSLPQSVGSLQYDSNDDQVSSAGIGFVGLIIERVYRGSNDMELKASVGNDSAVLGLAGLYLTDGLYVQSTDETNLKQIRFQDHRASIQYTDYEGYTITVPFGQSSMFVLKGVNYDSENDFMAAANAFDISKIKKELGEQ